MIKKKITITSLIILFSLFLISFMNNVNDLNGSSSFETNNDQLKISSSLVNGKSLLINQYANISKSIEGGSTFPKNVSFNLAPDWTSKNVTINYEGVAQKKDWVINGTLDSQSDMSAWTYYERESGTYLSNEGYDSYGNPSGSMRIKASSIEAGDIAYFEQNLSISEEFDSGDALISADVQMAYSAGRFNGSLFISLTIDGYQINNTAHLESIQTGVWVPLSITYNPIAYGHVLPNIASLKVGVFAYEDDSIVSWQDFYFDNIKYEPWTKPNISNIIIANDNEFNQNYTYDSTGYGEGYSFIDLERYRSVSDSIVFTIYQNLSDVIDFKVESYIINSAAIKSFNSSLLGSPGSLYTLGANITWQLEFSITSIPDGYTSWVEIEKPRDWVFHHVIDGFEAEQIGNCIGTEFGSNRLKIPTSVLTFGLYKLEAVSENYITKGNMALWNQNQFLSYSKFTYNSLFQVNISLNNTISLPNTKINATIYFPNNTIFIHESKTPSSYNFKFGNYTVGESMPIGSYRAEILWINNQSYIDTDKIGFLELSFSIWHHTNLTAVDSDLEKIAGDPLLIKIKYIDYDINESIHFADVTYNSTFGTSGTMAYLGSGVYFVDIDTNSLLLGDYYFSFNASKAFYENQTIRNLIHLKIVAQPLDLEVPHSALEGNANSIISCNINTTGAISGTKVYPVNISTNWFNQYNITDHNNGSYTLDFSTLNIPTSGFLESYNIKIFANKTHYGSTNEFLTLLVHPLSTVAQVNTSLVSVNSNNVVNLKVNYTKENSSEIITNSICSLTWQSSYMITPVADGFNIKLFTTGLVVDYYTAFIKLEKAGYEYAFVSVTIIIIEQDVDLTVTINSEIINENFLIDSFFQQTINISSRVYALIDEEFLSGGVITLLSNNIQRNLTESPSTIFSTSLVLDGANFDSGINTIFLRFEQANYTTKIFPFQLFIRAQNVNLSARINNQVVRENYLLAQSFNEAFQVSCRAFADLEGVFLSGGSITFINGDFEVELLETADYWFNQTILINTLHFSIGPNYVYLKFQKNNYTTTIFAFQIIVNQIKINVETLDFEGITSGAPGETIVIKLNLTETGSSTNIENATTYYSWIFGVGYFDDLGSGIYELRLNLPNGVAGNYEFEIIISKEGILYETKVYSFFIAINQVEGPNWLLWVIIISLVVISSVLGVLSLRSYVIIPKRREKEADLISRIQVYKDVWNIRAVILIQKISGLPIYSEEISMSEDHDSLLISGFIQAITAFSETFVDQELKGSLKLATDYEYLRTIIDLDFKFFQLLVCDYESIRILLVLRDEASDQLKKQLYTLTVEVNSQFSEKIENFTGAISSSMEKELGNLLNHFLFLHYNRPFEITPNQDYLQSVIESDELSKMEKRLINTISSMTKINKMFTLRAVIDLIDEKNEDIVLEALNFLILRKVIISPYSTKLYQKKEKN